MMCICKNFGFRTWPTWQLSLWPLTLGTWTFLTPGLSCAVFWDKKNTNFAGNLIRRQKRQYYDWFKTCCTSTHTWHIISSRQLYINGFSSSFQDLPTFQTKMFCHFQGGSIHWDRLLQSRTAALFNQLIKILSSDELRFIRMDRTASCTTDGTSVHFRRRAEIDCCSAGLLRSFINWFTVLYRHPF
jgi:hypothetical protein